MLGMTWFFSSLKQIPGDSSTAGYYSFFTQPAVSTEMGQRLEEIQLGVPL